MLFILLDWLFGLVEVARKGLDVGVVLLPLIGGVPGFISMPLPKALVPFQTFVQDDSGSGPVLVRWYAVMGAEESEAEQLKVAP